MRIIVVLGALFLHDAAVAFLPPTASSEKLLSPRRWERTSADEYAMLQDDDDDDEPVPPGQMRVSEIKAELDLRGISYADCFDKESLADRLVEARATGKANPEILDKFNRQKIEETFKGEKVELKDYDIEAAVANDGTLPGGLTPDQFKKLTSNPEIMTLLQSSKMQEAMKVMVSIVHSRWQICWASLTLCLKLLLCLLDDGRARGCREKNQG